MTLLPCPGCARHVRAGSERCPFCARSLDAVAIAPVDIPIGASRTALVVLGAALALGACSQPTPGGGGGTAIVQPYGAPIPPPPSASASSEPPKTSR